MKGKLNEIELRLPAVTPQKHIKKHIKNVYKDYKSSALMIKGNSNVMPIWVIHNINAPHTEVTSLYQ